MISPKQDTLWGELFDEEKQSVARILGLWSRIADKIGVLEQALRTPHQRGTALRLLLLLQDDSLRRSLFPTLVELASVGHKDVALCRAVIKAMPREWVLKQIEPLAEAILRQNQNEPEEEYRRFAELFHELDGALLRRHLDRALRHPEESVREIAQDFQECLSGD
jgi:hypothetical protein